MEGMIQQLASVFEQIRQPVLLLKGEQLIYRNPAAEQQLPSLTPEQAGQLTDDATTIDGQHWRVTRQEIEGLTALILETTDAEALIPTQLLDVVAQTMRGALSVALSVAQTLFPRLEEQENARVQQETAAMNHSFYQLLRLAGNLSDVSHYLKGNMVLHRQQVDVVLWIQRLGEKLESYCRMKQVELELETPKETCWVWFDVDQVERALLNLVSNALKYTEPGGRITLRLEIGKAQLRLKVIDNGEGLDPALLETLYWRALSRDALGDARWGVGLGLQLVRQIASAHGGTVMAERRAGGGSCVTISLERVNDLPEGNLLRSAATIYDYSGGYNHILLELSDALPLEAFDSSEVN